MGLLDDLKPVVKIWPCQVRDKAATLDPSDAEKLIAAVMDPAWKYQALEVALAERGIQISQQVIKKHRLGTCSCSKI